MGSRQHDITNKKFNKLTAIKFEYSKIVNVAGTTKHYWLFQCECG